MSKPSAEFYSSYFVHQLERLYAVKYEGQSLFERVDYIVSINDKERKRNIQTSFMFWLFGVYMNDTIVIFGKKNAYFLYSKQLTRNFLSAFNNTTLQKIKYTIDLDVQIFNIDDGEKYESNFLKTIELMKVEMKSNRVGIFEYDKDNNKTLTKPEEVWNKLLLESNWTLVDMNKCACSITSIKEDKELEILKQAFRKCQNMYFTGLSTLANLLIFGNVSGNEVPTNENIAEEIKRFAMASKSGRQPYDTVEFYYPPVVQSGGSYDSDMKSGSNKEKFIADIIILSFGIKYRRMVSSITRSYVAYPNETIEGNYLFLQEIEKYIVKLLQDGVKLGDVHEGTIDFVKANRPDINEHLTENFGWVIGVRPNDTFYKIEKDSKEIAREGMIFNITVRVDNLVDETKKYMVSYPHTYSLCLGDMFKVEKGKPATPLTRIFHLTNEIILRSVSAYRQNKNHRNE